MKKILLMLALLSTVATTYAEEENQEEKGYKLDAIRVFGTDGKNYRIPALLYTRRGVLIAAADNRFNGGGDWNNIDTVIRVSKDSGKTFGEEKTVIDLADAPGNSSLKSAFLIDPSLMDNDDEVLMLVDMFPKSQGFFTVAQEEAGSGYEEINGTKYQKLHKYNDSTYKYYINSTGNVFKKTANSTNLEETTLKVIREAEAPFKALGDIYDTSTNERIGNIYRGRLSGENNADQYDGDYIINRTSHLWLTRTSDDGQNWSSPVDITPMVKKDYMSFLGTGPGVGIKLRNGEHAGRLLFPVYYTTDRRPNNSGPRADGESQQSALIYSDDNGSTWKIGESIMENREVTIPGTTRTLTLNDQIPRLGGFQLTESQVVELNNGTLKLFMRGFHQSSKGQGGAIHIGTSTDGGVTWENTTEEFPFEAPYSQVAAIHYGNIGNEEFVLVAAPSHRTSRSDLKIYLGLVKEDNSIEWIGNKVHQAGSGAYGSVTKLEDGDIGILYETSNLNIDFTRLSIDWIAPDHVFKDFLPFPKEYTKLRYRNELFDILNENTISGEDFGDLEKGKATLRYNRGKLGEKQYHSVEAYGILKDNFGVYSRFTVSDKKDFSGNISGYALFENDYISGYQTLGLDYRTGKDVKFTARGYKINIPNQDNIILRATTKLKLKGFNYDNLSIVPEANLDIQYLGKDKREAINQENISIDLESKGIYNVKSSVGVNLGYQGEKIKTEVGTGLTNNYSVLSFEDKEYSENKLGYLVKGSLDFKANDNISIGAKLKYSNEFKNNDLGHLNGSIEVNYTW